MQLGRRKQRQGSAGNETGSHGFLRNFSCLLAVVVIGARFYAFMCVCICSKREKV